ncbi:MAG: hypothetical protein HFF80_10300 [Oscillospiraceae bacterium]|nr:hypothetical protein [Oscillospiraceae bacterium]
MHRQYECVSDGGGAKPRAKGYGCQVPGSRAPPCITKAAPGNQKRGDQSQLKKEQQKIVGGLYREIQQMGQVGFQIKKAQVVDLQQEGRQRILSQRPSQF